MKKRLLMLLLVGIIVSSLIPLAFAQSGELAATLEVLEAGVDVKRVNTSDWIAVSVEAIVGVGDLIRTDDTGRARITFFADGVDTDLLPNTEYQIEQFEGDGDSFHITVEVLIGQTTQRLNRALDANSSYNVNTPAMTLATRGTAFAIRVDEGGERAALLVSNGTVQAEPEDMNLPVPSGFGVRSEVDGELSDTVRATTFDELDSGLDGCAVSITTPDDVQLNVRVSPSLDAPRAGTIAAAEIDIFMGRSESGNWYRINFRGGFGWVLSSTATLDSACAGLRMFPEGHGPEDATLYAFLGDEINIEDLAMPEPESTTEPDTESSG